MSQETSAVPSPGAGLLGKLMAAVRPEFRVDVFIPEPGELIFGLGACRVPGCPRQPAPASSAAATTPAGNAAGNRTLKRSSPILEPIRSGGPS
ncbi:hypothetical protein ACIOMQ_37570 [Streptomyces sp. NPDC087845]|uniref:hypothetical protein n=1 Tax=Streptomyces sp. NPDC087845 TaxID=3365806 RepID=UPI003813A3CB